MSSSGGVGDVKAYYLYGEDEVDPTTKKAVKLRGWRRSIADLLYKQRVSDTDTAEAIQSLIRLQFPVAEQRQTTSSQQAIRSEILKLLPRNLKAKAELLLKYMSQFADIGDDWRVIYRSDGEIGGSLIDHLRYFASSSMLKIPAPADYSRMRRELERVKTPLASFGRGRSVYEALKVPRKADLHWRVR